MIRFLRYIPAILLIFIVPIVSSGLYAWTATAQTQGGSSAAEIIEITADGNIEYDNQKKVITADKNVVAVYGSRTIRGDRMSFEEKSQKLMVTGSVRIKESAANGWAMACNEMTYLVNDNRIFATGAISASMDNAQLSGNSLEADFHAGTARLQGNCRLVYEDITATGDIVDFDRNSRKAQVTGNAQVKSGGRVFSGGKITIFLNEKRVVGSEGTRLVIPIEKQKQ